MKKLLLILTSFVIAACGSCATMPMYTGPQMEDLALNVYKIETKVVVDVQPLNEALKKAGIDIGDDPKKTFEFGSWGTAWVLARPNGTVIMTAGHVCESAWTYKDDMLEIIGVDHLDVISYGHKLIDVDGKVVASDLEVLRDWDDIEEGRDLCALRTPANLHRAGIPLATQDPPYGADVRYVGAPRGVWGGGHPLIFPGLFSGRGALFDWGEALTFNFAKAAPGSSGSPVIYNGEAIAVYNLGSTRHDATGSGVPWNVIREFLKGL